MNAGTQRTVGVGEWPRTGRYQRKVSLLKARVWYLIPLAVLALGAVAGCGDQGANAPPPPGYDTNKPGAVPTGAMTGGKPGGNGPMSGPGGGNGPANPPGPGGNGPH
jgi:hypothetical protein